MIRESRDYSVNSDMWPQSPNGGQHNSGETRQARPESEHKQPKPRQVDAQCANHLTVMSAGLDDGSIGRTFQEQPDKKYRGYRKQYCEQLVF